MPPAPSESSTSTSQPTPEVSNRPTGKAKPASATRPPTGAQPPSTEAETNGHQAAEASGTVEVSITELSSSDAPATEVIPTEAPAAEAEKAPAETTAETVAEATAELPAQADTEPAGETEPAADAGPAGENGPAADGEPDEADRADAVAATPTDAPEVVERRRVRRLFALAVAAVVLVAASVVLGVGAFTARDSGPLANQAFVDSAATADVVGQVTNAITTVYSYDYRTLPANEAAAKAVVTGKFADEFTRVFEPVKQLAPKEQAVLKSTVPAAGVSLLQGDRARLLMMVNQTGTRGADKQPTGATARLVVDAQKIDGRWKISEVTPE